MRPKVLVFASEVLGAINLHPVVEALTGVDVRVINDGFCQNKIDELGFDYALVTDDNELADAVRASDIVLTGKSYSRETEPNLVKLCAAYGVPSAILLSDLGGEIALAKLDNLEVMPNFILTVDPVTTRYLIQNEVPPERIVRAGSPYFDQLHARSNGKHPNTKFRITYLDVIFESDFRRGILPAGPYSKEQYINDIARAVSQIPDVDFRIRLHPESDPKDFSAATKNGVQLVDGEDSYTTITKSDMVISSYSTTLLESVVARTPAISYQPWTADIRGDIFAGAIPIAKNPQELQKAIAESRSYPTGHIQFYNPGNSARWISRWIHNQVSSRVKGEKAYR